VIDGTRQLGALLVERRGCDAVDDLHLAIDVLRLGGAAIVRPVAAELARTSDSKLAEVTAAWAVAVVRHSAATLVDVADEFDKLGYRLLAAEALTAALVARRNAANAATGELEERRAALRAQLPEVRSSSLHPPFAQLRLAPRMREVAAVAATGLAGKEIAAIMGIGHRTVESYLRNAYARLGVANRSKLADAFELPPRPNLRR
jgi:DNA-binding CsgD family transcriptional regulator